MLIIGLSIFVFSSCEKDTIKRCNCGVIVNDGITNGCHWLEIENSCTGNKKTFCFDENTLDEDNYVGTYFCIFNEPKW